MGEFRNPEGIGRAAGIVLIAWMVAAVLYGGAAIFSIVVIKAHQAGESAAWVDLDMADLAAAVTGGIYLVAFLVCTIVVGRWIYRVNKNAWQISDGMTVSPGWAVGSYFIPILNLFRPFRGMRETWQASHAPGDPGSATVPGIMRLWWAGWLITSALGQASFRLGMRAETLDDFLTVAQIDAVGTVTDLIAGAAMLWIVRRLTDVQGRLHDYEVFE